MLLRRRDEAGFCPNGETVNSLFLYIFLPKSNSLQKFQVDAASSREELHMKKKKLAIHGEKATRYDPLALRELISTNPPSLPTPPSALHLKGLISYIRQKAICGSPKLEEEDGCQLKDMVHQKMASIENAFLDLSQISDELHQVFHGMINTSLTSSCSHPKVGENSSKK